MGNSAMKCLRGRGRSVTVVLLSGEIADFKEPVKAATVMKRYPQHVVLHCSTVSKGGMGQRRRISVLKPDQALKRNQNYLITPIQTAGNAKPFLDSWALLIISANKKLNTKIRQKAHRGSPNERSWIKTMFGKIFRFPKSYHGLEEDASRPLLRCNRVSSESRKSCKGLQDWRPSLECIPESYDVES